MYNCSCAVCINSLSVCVCARVPVCLQFLCVCARVRERAVYACERELWMSDVNISYAHLMLSYKSGERPSGERPSEGQPSKRRAAERRAAERAQSRRPRERRSLSDSNEYTRDSDSVSENACEMRQRLKLAVHTYSRKKPTLFLFFGVFLEFLFFVHVDELFDYKLA